MNNKEKYFLTKLARRGRKTNIVEPPVQVELEDPTPPTVELPEAPDNSDWPTSEKFPHPADKIPEWMKKVRLGPGGPHNKKPSPPPKNKYGPFENFRLGPGGPHNKKSSKQAGALLGAEAGMGDSPPQIYGGLGAGMGAAAGVGGLPLEVLLAKNLREAQSDKRLLEGTRDDPALKGIADESPDLLKGIEEQKKTIEELEPQVPAYMTEPNPVFPDSGTTL